MPSPCAFLFICFLFLLFFYYVLFFLSFFSSFYLYLIIQGLRFSSCLMLLFFRFLSYSISIFIYFTSFYIVFLYDLPFQKLYIWLSVSLCFFMCLPIPVFFSSLSFLHPLSRSPMNAHIQFRTQRERKNTKICIRSATFVCCILNLKCQRHPHTPCSETTLRLFSKK